MEEGFVRKLDMGGAGDAEDDIMNFKTLGAEAKPTAGSKAKGKTRAKRRKSRYDGDDDDEAYGGDNGIIDTSFITAESCAPRAPVAPQAWPILDWLLNALEKDEENAVKLGSSA